MNRIAVVMAAGVAMAGVTWAGPKDKTAETMVNPSSIAGSADWNNFTVATKVKSSKCKVVISAKTKVIPDLVAGPVVCLLEADVRAAALGPGLFGNSVVVAGNSLDGKLLIKADLRSIGCGIQSDALALNGKTTCYQVDPVAYNWSATCGGAGMLPVPPNLLAGTESFNPGGLLGLCQGGTAGAGERIPPPGVPILAEQGQLSPLL